MNGTVKAKCIFVFTAMKTGKELKCQIELTDHYLSILLPSLSTSVSHLAAEMIQSMFSPLYRASNSSLNINYSLIKSVQILKDSKSIRLDIINPVMKVDFSFTLKQFETASLVFKRKLSSKSLHLLGLELEQRGEKETKHLIQKIIQLITALRDSIDPQKEDNKLIECILCQSYVHGRLYYEKYTGIYKSNMKIKKGIKKQLNEKLKMLDSMISEQEQIKKNLTCACFDSLLNEIKIRTSSFLEESIVLFFQIISLENQILDFKNVDKGIVSDNLRTLKDEGCNSSNILGTGDYNKSNNGPCIKQKQKQRQDHNNTLMPNKGKTGLLRNETSNSNNNRMNKSCNDISHYATVDAEAFDRLNQSANQNYSNSNANNIHIKDLGLGLLNNTHYTSTNMYIDNQDISISTKNTSKKKDTEPLNDNKKAFCFAINTKDILETPKFNTFNSNNNMHYNYNCNYKYLKPKSPYDNNNKKDLHPASSSPNANKAKTCEASLSMMEIMKQIDFLIKKHSFVPPNDVYNIFANTSEIIHRKFFELCFETFLGKLFSYEMDKDNLIKIDSLYNYFLYLRGVKNYLFMEKNKIYCSSMIFNNDDV